MKKKSAAYVSLERAELKGRFAVVSRRTASVGAPLAGALQARYEQTNDLTLEETKSLYVR